MIVERSEELQWRGHLECSEEDWDAIANAMKEIELLVANAVKRNDKPVNHTIK